MSISHSFLVNPWIKAWDFQGFVWGGGFASKPVQKPAHQGYSPAAAFLRPHPGTPLPWTGSYYFCVPIRSDSTFTVDSRSVYTVIYQRGTDTGPQGGRLIVSMDTPANLNTYTSVKCRNLPGFQQKPHYRGNLTRCWCQKKAEKVKRRRRNGQNF